jgi:hypothetical protein
MQPTLTPKQQRFYNYLENAISRDGQTPSLRQAAADMGVSHGPSPSWSGPSNKRAWSGGTGATAGPSTC